jgi:hypothetical protein
MGFSNPLIGGAAALIRAAIKSPNYVAGLAGWIISKTGSAEFNDIHVRGNIVSTNLAGTLDTIINAGIMTMNAHGVTDTQVTYQASTDSISGVTIAAVDTTLGIGSQISLHSGAPTQVTQPIMMENFLIGGGTIWHAVGYPPGWSTQSGGFQRLEYSIDGTGRVWLRGGVSVAASNAVGLKFTLAAGYAPVALSTVSVPMVTTPGTPNFQVMQRFNIDTAGGFTMLTATPASTQFMTFDNVSFSTVI